MKKDFNIKFGTLITLGVCLVAAFLLWLYFNIHI